jgi:hypothetical protein
MYVATLPANALAATHGLAFCPPQDNPDPHDQRRGVDNVSSNLPYRRGGSRVFGGGRHVQGRNRLRRSVLPGAEAFLLALVTAEILVPHDGQHDDSGQDQQGRDLTSPHDISRYPKIVPE